MQNTGKSSFTRMDLRVAGATAADDNKYINKAQLGPQKYFHWYTVRK